MPDLIETGDMKCWAVLLIDLNEKPVRNTTFISAWSDRGYAELAVLHGKRDFIRDHWIDAETGEEMPDAKAEWLGNLQAPDLDDLSGWGELWDRTIGSDNFIVWDIQEGNLGE
jgi:hypothetical protein